LSAMITLKGKTVFRSGEEYILGPAGPDTSAPGYIGGYEAVGSLRAGSYLGAQNHRFQVIDKFWKTDNNRQGGIFIKLRALDDISVDSELGLSQLREGFSLAWITLSDKGAKGQRIDESGPLIEEIAGSSLQLSLAAGFIIPDDPVLLKSLMVHLALTSGFDLVITTGGTGLGPRDITPEVTLDIIDKRLPGFEQAMLNYSLTKTPHAVISRAVGGTLGLSLVINLPGSPRGVRENLEVVLPALGHALNKLQGDQSDCAAKV
jgi:molybdopterin adenylyltransferase